MTPAISIVLPVRNGAPYLPNAINSLLAQSQADYELLAIDDGSEDGTPEILSDYAGRDRRIRVIRTAALGLVPALNRGISEARAPLLARMDADDSAAPNRLALQKEVLDREPDVVLVASAWRVVDGTGRVRRIVHPPADATALHAELLRRNPIAHGSVLIRRAAVQEIGGYRPAFRLAEDYDLWLRLAERHRLSALPDILLDYREHPGQSSLADLEQRIVSELGAKAASAVRRSGEADGCEGPTPLRQIDLRRLGLTAAEVRLGLLSGALGAAEDAVKAGHSRAARAAIALGFQQGPLRLRTRLHLHWLALRLNRFRLSDG